MNKNSVTVMAAQSISVQFQTMAHVDQLCKHNCPSIFKDVPSQRANLLLNKSKREKIS